MNLDLIARQLNDEFNIRNIPPDEPFSRILPKIYDAAHIEFRRYVTDLFLQTYHGLMLKNGETVGKVYLAVFLSGEILDKIFAQDVTDAMIFVHHPMDMESSGRGFLPMEEKYFLEMRRRKISVYILHTPLDIHKNISTSRSIAKLLQLQRLQEYNLCFVGYAGIYGTLKNEVSFIGFINSLKEIFNLNEIHYLQRFPTVYRVGIIAGGGADIEYIKESMDIGCDTYLSGDYLNKVKTENSIRRRVEFEKTKDSLRINLIECSHYATEKVVLLNEMRNYFISLGLPAEFVDRADYWK